MHFIFLSLHRLAIFMFNVRNVALLPQQQRQRHHRHRHRRRRLAAAAATFIQDRLSFIFVHILILKCTFHERNTRRVHLEEIYINIVKLGHIGSKCRRDRANRARSDHLKKRIHLGEKREKAKKIAHR